MSGPVHFMTIQTGNWCGAAPGPGNGSASSQWAEVTCAACAARRTERLLSLVWDMLAVMGPSREALRFAVRAGRLGVRNEQGRPLAMACAPDSALARHPSREVNLLADDERDFAEEDL